MTYINPKKSNQDSCPMIKFVPTAAKRELVGNHNRDEK